MEVQQWEELERKRKRLGCSLFNSSVKTAPGPLVATATGVLKIALNCQWFICSFVGIARGP